MNQPSNTIIEIGAVAADMATGAVLDKFQRYIRIDEAIREDIAQLTGITDFHIQSGISLDQAYRDLVEFAHRYGADSHLIVWGSADFDALRTQIAPHNQEWIFGHRYLDVKTMFQFLQIKKGKSLRAGLGKAMFKNGLHFQGTQHSAPADAENTFRLAHHLVRNGLI